jgi:hypothetical protein
MFHFIRSFFSINQDENTVALSEVVSANLSSNILGSEVLVGPSDFESAINEKNFQNDNVIFESPDLTKEFLTFQLLKEYLDNFCMGSIQDDKNYKGYSYVIQRSITSKNKYYLRCCKGGNCKSTKVKFR